jgi:hypothetical protein
LIHNVCAFVPTDDVNAGVVFSIIIITSSSEMDWEQPLPTNEIELMVTVVEPAFGINAAGTTNTPVPPEKFNVAEPVLALGALKV